MKNPVLFLILNAFLITSCVRDKMVVETAGGIPLTISCSIEQKSTKASSAGFSGGDALGLFAVNYCDGNTAPGALMTDGNQVDNVKFTLNENKHVWESSGKVYYKDANTNVDLYLYYPFLKEISDISADMFEVSRNQSLEATSTSLGGYEASDFLWGKATDVIPGQAAVPVALHHMMSAVEVKLAPGSGFGEGEFASLPKTAIVENTTRKASIDFSTGVVTPIGGSQSDGIVMCPQANGNFRAIVVPQTISSGMILLTLTVDGISYSVRHAEPVTYYAGKQRVFSIVVNKKGLTGDYEFQMQSAGIIDWVEDSNAHDGEARQYLVVDVGTPGRLGSAIKSRGKNPDKIRNLKVTGKVDRTDFYFMRDSMKILESVNMKDASICATGQVIASSKKEYSEYTELVAVYGEPDSLAGGICYWRDDQDGVVPQYAFHNKKTLCSFIFPETATCVDQFAFLGSGLAGPLILSDGITSICHQAFCGMEITSLTLPESLKAIGESAFEECTSLSGSLTLPNGLTYIGESAFCSCNFTGYLVLPEMLSFLGAEAFRDAGSFSGDLRIPANVKALNGTFMGTSFSGHLIFEGNPEIGDDTFCGCGLSGTLVIPEGCTVIPSSCFGWNSFTSVVFPSSACEIGDRAFCNNSLETIDIPEGVTMIGKAAFADCERLAGITLPSTLDVIGEGAFDRCYEVSSIICNAADPPALMGSVFLNVPKDNFALEVPEKSVSLYMLEDGWSDFKRIVAHHDFSVGRNRVRLLNKGRSYTYLLRCPSGKDWTVKSKPDWVTVTPDSGTGKTELTISVSDMPRTYNSFSVSVGRSTKSYKGRKDEIVFNLVDKDYTCKMDIEQYDYDYSDGDAVTLCESSKGKGVNIVFVGNGYDARDIADGTFLSNVREGCDDFFNVEPYSTYKEYFNVCSIVSMSGESGIEDVSTVVDNKFRDNGEVDDIGCLSWVKNMIPTLKLSETVVVLLENTEAYYGWTDMWEDGTALAVVPVSRQAYPLDFRGLIQHEAGGHAFGKLGDEYVYHNAHISNCICNCGDCEHPTSEYDTKTSFGRFKKLGWYKNITMKTDLKQVPWAHLVYHPTYSNVVDIYEGGFMHARGIYRSESTSCMNNNIPYFSTISRQAIVERIKNIAGESFSLEEFYTKDSFAIGTRSSDPDLSQAAPGVSLSPLYKEKSVIYKGDYPKLEN